MYKLKVTALYVNFHIPRKRRVTFAVTFLYRTSFSLFLKYLLYRSCLENWPILDEFSLMIIRVFFFLLLLLLHMTFRVLVKTLWRISLSVTQIQASNKNKHSFPPSCFCDYPLRGITFGSSYRVVRETEFLLYLIPYGTYTKKNNNKEVHLGKEMNRGF